MDGTHKGLGAILSVSDRRNLRELPASRVKVPEDMVAITDSNADGWIDYVTSAWATHPLARPGTVHSGRTNALFCDGHVEWLRLDDLCITSRSDAAQASKVRRWNNDHSFGL
jgi:prepilin-type processing-associated H-X9-DG protein